MKIELSKEAALTLEKCIALTMEIVAQQTCECGQDDCGLAASQEVVISACGELILELKQAGFEFANMEVQALNLGEVDVHDELETVQ